MRRAVTAGIVTSVVGYTSAFAVVLAGLQGVGATPAQAASGLAALCVLMGLSSILISVRHRMPVTIAWSTPGAALLATTGAQAGGWPLPSAFLCTRARPVRCPCRGSPSS